MGAHAVVLELLQIPYEKVGFLYSYCLTSCYIDGFLTPHLNLPETSTFLTGFKEAILNIEIPKLIENLYRFCLLKVFECSVLY